MTRTEATARVIDQLRWIAMERQYGRDAPVAAWDQLWKNLVDYDSSTPDSEGGWRKRVAEILDLDGEAHARHNLDGAYIDLEREGADSVCLKTLRRVRTQLREIEIVLEDALPAPPAQEQKPT